MFTHDILKYSYEIVVRVIFCNFGTFNFFSSKLVQTCPNSFTFESKIEKIYMGVFSTQFFQLISILDFKVTYDDKQSCQFLTVYLTNFFCQTFVFILLKCLILLQNLMTHDHFELQKFILAQKLTLLEGGLHWWL